MVWTFCRLHAPVLTFSLKGHTTLRLKKRHPFYFCYKLVRCHPIFQFLAETHPRKFKTHKCTAHHISFHMFIPHPCQVVFLIIRVSVNACSREQFARIIHANCSRE